jgi:flagellar biosynthesis GTPase FlhF
VGPTGGGKTTAVAKLAAELVRRGRHPLLITTDGESFAGEENLASVAAALGLEMRRAFFEGQLAQIIEGLPADKLVLVDTPGCAAREPGALDKLRAIRRTLPQADVLLVIPATTDREEAHALVEGYSTLGKCRIVLTKLDELCRPGRIVDLARAVTQPVAWVTFGRGVQGTCSTPDDPAVVKRILGSGRTLLTSA